MHNINRSEEDIKVKVIIEWLRSIGFSEDELFYGTTLYGHFASDIERKIIYRYPDILVKRDGRYLYVIEVKKDNNKLTDKDRDQAVQYARMLDPIAPIAIVTSGRESKMYSVTDNSEIVDKGANGYSLNLQDINNKYDDVFERFVSLSPENIKKHCEDQTKKEMVTLLGSHEDRSKKFIPELYVASKKLASAFSDFMRNDKPVFALIGESASGKTCAMCSMARELEKESPVLFYRALHLTEGIEKSIANDFNWKFSAHQDEITLLKRLGITFKDHKLIIFIDAIDEWGDSNKVENLGKFASHVREGNIKLVMSCKKEQWNKFLYKSGVPTALSQEVYSARKNQIGYYIEPFDAEELHGPNGLIGKYRDFYNFHGAFEKDVLEECKKSPFLLRVFFEVANKNREKLTRLSFSVKEFYDEYYRQAVLDRIPQDNGDVIYTLKEIARLLYENNSDALDIDAARRNSNANFTENVMAALYEANILEKTTDGLNSQVRFYFQKLRDYIIAFGVKNYDKMAIDEFKKEWASLYLTDIQLDIINFYYPFADAEKKRYFDRTVGANAEKYLNLYVQIIDSHFPNLKYRFSPQTNGTVGFIGAFDIGNRMITAYGFRQIGNDSDKVVLVPDNGGFWTEKPNNMYLMGASHIHYHGACKGFQEFNVKKEVLKGEIESQLWEIINNGLLNESENYYLALERVLGIVVSMQQSMHGIKDRDRLTQYLPISLAKVEYGLRYSKASDHYMWLLINKKRKDGIIKSTWHGSGCSFPISLTEEEKKLISTQADKAANEKIEYPSPNIDFIKIDKAMKEAIETIKKKNSVLDETILPDQEKIPSRYENYDDLYEKETLISFVPRFYSLFLQEYKTLIEINFPKLKSKFKLYSLMPLHYFILVDIEYANYFALFYQCSNADSKENEVTLCRDKDEIIVDDDGEALTYNGKTYRLLHTEYSTFSVFPSMPFLNYQVPSEFTALRGRVYQQIYNELSAVLKQLSTIYGVD